MGDEKSSLGDRAFKHRHYTQGSHALGRTQNSHMKLQNHVSSPSRAKHYPESRDSESRVVNPNVKNPNTRTGTRKRKCPRPGVSERAALNRKRALELRIGCWSYRQIAAEIGVSLDTAWHYVNDGIMGIATESAEVARNLRTLELARIESREGQMVKREMHWERLALRALGNGEELLTTEWIAANGDALSLALRAESALCKLAEQRTKLAERRAELHGLDATIKINPADQGPLTLEEFRGRMEKVRGALRQRDKSSDGGPTAPLPAV